VISVDTRSRITIPLLERIVPVKEGLMESYYRVLRDDYKALTSGVTLSPDGRWLLNSQVDQEGSELMLVQNFR
jgi:hypothetical protein